MFSSVWTVMTKWCTVVETGADVHPGPDVPCRACSPGLFSRPRFTAEKGREEKAASINLVHRLVLQPQCYDIVRIRYDLM